MVVDRLWMQRCAPQGLGGYTSHTSNVLSELGVVESERASERASLSVYLLVFVTGDLGSMLVRSDMTPY